MNIPGFDADLSIYRSTSQYSSAAVAGEGYRSGANSIRTIVTQGWQPSGSGYEALYAPRGPREANGSVWPALPLGGYQQLACVKAICKHFPSQCGSAWSMCMPRQIGSPGGYGDWPDWDTSCIAFCTGSCQDSCAGNPDPKCTNNCINDCTEIC